MRSVFMYEIKYCTYFQTGYDVWFSFDTIKRVLSFNRTLLLVIHFAYLFHE